MTKPDTCGRDRPCQTCEGTGNEAMPRISTGPSGEPELHDCPDCHGTGRECAGGEPDICDDCTDPEIYPGRVYNNSDVTSGMWVKCSACNGTGEVCPTCGLPLEAEHE